MPLSDKERLAVDLKDAVFLFCFTSFFVLLELEQSMQLGG
jgi:hypothetical protein